MENHNKQLTASRHLRRSIILLKSLIWISLALAIFLLLAPYLINTLLVPHLVKNQIGTKLTITTLTPWSLSGQLSVGAPDNPSVHLPRVTMKYSPTRLIRGVVDVFLVEGGSIQLSLNDGRLTFRDLELPQRTADIQTTTTILPSLPLRINKVRMQNVHIMIARPFQQDISLDTRLVTLPAFSGNLKEGFTLSELDFTLQTSGSLNSDLHAKVTKSADTLNTSITARIPEFGQLSALIPVPDQIKLQGKGQITTKFSSAIDLSSFTELQGKLSVADLQVKSNHFMVGKTDSPPLVIHLFGSSKLLHYELNNLDLNEPLSLQSGLRGSYIPATGALQGKGIINAKLLTDPVNVSFTGNIMAEEKEMSLSIEGEKQQFDLQSEIITLGPYSFHLSGRKKGKEMQLSQKFAIASLTAQHRQLRLQNISANSTHRLNSVPPPDTKTGNFSIGSISYNGEDLAEIQASLRPLSKGLAYSGTLDTHLASPLRFVFNGSSTIEQPLKLQVQLPESSVDNYSLPSFSSFPPDLSFSGKLTLDTELRVMGNQPSGHASIAFTDGKLTAKQQDLVLQGIETTIDLPEISRITSKPSQHLSIDTIDIGTIKLKNGSVYYRLEDSDTLFIENSSFAWCGGKVESGSLRINTKNPELRTTFYCDRLQFSELLSQVGISNTEGNGSLNGRLPIHFTGKEIVFDDGFLFSTPGNSGIVRFNNTAMLRQGMPDAGKAAYLEYSIQAMENFSYNWTKLTFNSEGDDLLVKMQIDGKPASPLPFGYKSGQITRDTEGTGIQHPIRLDVNFHLPIKQMFIYGRNLKKLMEKM